MSNMHQGDHQQGEVTFKHQAVGAKRRAWVDLQEVVTLQLTKGWIRCVQGWRRRAWNKDDITISRCLLEQGHWAVDGSRVELPGAQDADRGQLLF